MKQFEIRKGSKVIRVTISGNPTDGFRRPSTLLVSARLYVDNGNVATLVRWNGKTESGARSWAARQLKGGAE